MMERALAYVRTLFEKDSSGHDFAHTLRVYKLAVRIAEQEGADIDIVSLAAILHDADDRKLFPETAKTKAHAVSFMRQEHLDEDTIARVVHIIDQVSFKGTDSEIPDTMEGKCVQDADRLDAIGAIGIARAFAYGGAHGRLLYDPDDAPLTGMDYEMYRNHKSATLNHFYEKLFLLKGMMNTETARAMAEERDRYMHGFVERFLQEWDGLS